MLSKIKKIFTPDPLKKYWEKVEIINGREPEFENKSDEELNEYSKGLKEKINSGHDSFEEAMPEAFALVRETAKRTLGQRHYDVQLIGGMVLHEGKIAEMLTGEGKTLASTLPIYMNALIGKGVHVITVNDYLAKRDTVWMGQVYHALDLSVACLIHDGALMYDPSFIPEEEKEELDKERDKKGSFHVVEKFLKPISRKEAYQADITYGTNHEFGFDYLRDNLVTKLSDRVQRDFNYTIIDEVDSILIDEARTPLIISAPDQQSSSFYQMFADIVKNLKEGEDYTIDEKKKTVSIDDSGVEKVEKILDTDNIFAPENSRMVHYLNESLKAKSLFHKDKDYVVRNNEVIIVDQFTGRLLEGRRYSSGLHQAIEAKEGVSVQQENRTYAQITIQNYFRMYDKVAGMTGTAQTSAEEFHKVYGLDVLSIPPNRPVIREDFSDVVYKTKDAKLKAVVEDVKKRNAKGQPILLGTTSVSNNEELSSYLNKAGVRHEVLNAKNNDREGKIIAQAGKPGAITVATNMAGRGVDIVLGGNPPEGDDAEKVKKAGGLHVVGTERHEARRIDDQLRGRSGRQGDPGSSQFFLSLEDDLLRVFGGERVGNMMQSFNIPEETPIEAGIVSKVINQAQKKVEGMNLDMRRHLLDFDDVLNRQRNSIYRRRLEYLKAGEEGKIIPVLKKVISDFVQKTKDGIENEIDELRKMDAEEKEIEGREKSLKEVDKALEKVPDSVESEKSAIVGQHLARILDSLWMNHLDNLQSLRESVGIRAYAQHEPIVEYRREAHALFQQLNRNFEILVYKSVFPLLEMDTEKIRANREAAERKQQEQENAKNNPGNKKIGRNDPCWCGSGKKYKRCHGK